MQNEEIIQIASRVIQQEASGVQSLLEQLDNAFIEAVRLIYDCEGHVLVAGAGTCNPVAARMAHLLSCCGTPALFIHPGDSQHGLSGAVTPRDGVFLISKGGETTEVIVLARIAKSRGAKLIALTEKPASTLASLSDVVLQIQSPPENDPYGMIATGSSLTNAAICDAICVVLLNMRGYSKEKFGETHPGGAVGIQLQFEKESQR